MTKPVKVQTASRLHFGLTSLGGSAELRHFGGIGAMVGAWGVHLQITPAEQFEVVGAYQERVEQVARRFTDYWQLPHLPRTRLEVYEAPAHHVGLGSGSQLGLAVVAGLAEATEFPWSDPHLLSRISGRGRRSAVGTYGFLEGGLIVDGGRLEDELLGRLIDRLPIPAEWRFVLIRQPTVTGRAGEQEETAIASLPPVREEITHELERLIHHEIVPATKSNDCTRFGEAVFAYGKLAGECFTPVQGGPFANRDISELVKWLRDQGVRGVGQSSWGPLVFAVVPDPQTAQDVLGMLQAHEKYQKYQKIMSAPANQGATVQRQ